MTKDDSGQFLLLTSIVIAVGLVVLLVFINQSSVSGYSSSKSIMNFPKNDIRDIRSATIVEAQQIAIAENNNILAADRKADFNNSFMIYAQNLKNLYAQQGDAVNVSCIGINPYEPSSYNYLDAAQFMLNYSNGDTSYGEIYQVNFNSSYATLVAKNFILVPSQNPVAHGSSNTFNLVVKAGSSTGSVVTTYTGTVTLTGAGLNGPSLTHTFVASDNGEYTFTGLYFSNSGSPVITASDGTISGTYMMTVT